MNPQTIRVRFAPSPTGHLHIGGLRTAIFNWLFARHQGGSFFLRIEDTDRERSKQEHLDSILEALRWMGVDHDGQIVIQTSRLAEHNKVINQLLSEGKAYRCFCSNELVQELKEELIAQGKLLRYDGRCRDKQWTQDDLARPHAIRFRLPYESGPISFNDLIRGTVTFDAQQFEDFIIARSDGMPMYNFVVVVDDAATGITHVIRGEDHISNTPKQILLYQACGYTVPQFAHIPLILGPSGERLSKRDGAVAVLDYRANGYLPEALYNYLVRLGWAHGDQELFTRDELISYFSLDEVGKKGSIFDPAKLDWVNGMYMRKAANEFLMEQVVAYIEPALTEKLSSFDRTQILSLIGLYKERVKTLKELAGALLDLHVRSYTFTQEELQQWVSDATVSYLEQWLARASSLTTFNDQGLAAMTKQLCADLGIKMGMLAQPLRLALTGKTASPGVFEISAILKKEESVYRITAFLQFLKTMRQ